VNIAITSNIALPVEKYGGAERIIWLLSKELVELGHEVTIVSSSKIRCNFANTLTLDLKSDIRSTLDHFDVVHFNTSHDHQISFPHIFRIGGNPAWGELLSQQSVFVSKNQANRYGSDVFIHNGHSNNLSHCASYPRDSFHFLGKAAWRRKNVKGSILCANKAKSGKLHVLGGNRLNFNMGFRFTPGFNTKFHGMVNDYYKLKIMHRSKGLVFPVLWNDPCPNAIIESLFAGCPVFGTPYGSLPELVPSEVGFLSASSDDLAEAMKDSQQWNPQVCRDYAVENFNSKKMALKYVEIYERVLDGEVLNKEPPQLKEVEPKLLPFT